MDLHSGGGKLYGGNAVVLFFEVVGVDGCVVAAIGLSLDAELVLTCFVLRESDSSCQQLS